MVIQATNILLGLKHMVDSKIISKYDMLSTSGKMPKASEIYVALLIQKNIVAYVRVPLNEKSSHEKEKGKELEKFSHPL